MKIDRILATLARLAGASSNRARPDGIGHLALPAPRDVAEIGADAQIQRSAERVISAQFELRACQVNGRFREQHAAVARLERKRGEAELSTLSRPLERPQTTFASQRLQRVKIPEGNRFKLDHCLAPQAGAHLFAG